MNVHILFFTVLQYSLWWYFLCDLIRGEAVLQVYSEINCSVLFLITGLPFAVLLILLVYSLKIGLQEEYEIEEAVRKSLIKVEKEHFLNEAITEVLQEENALTSDNVEYEKIEEKDK